VLPSCVDDVCPAAPPVYRARFFYAHAGALALVAALAWWLWPTQPFKPGDRVACRGCALVVHHAAGAPSPARPRPFWDAGLKAALKSRRYAVTCLFFFGVHSLRLNFYISTAAPQLALLGDADGSYLATFAVVFPMGALFIPFVGWLLDTKPMWWAFFFCNACGVASGLAALAPAFVGGSLTDAAPSTLDALLKAQVFTFVAFSAFRLALFSAIFAFVAHTWGFAMFGRLCGVAMLFCGAVALLQYPLIAASAARGSYDGANAGLLALGAAALYQQWHLRKDDAARADAARTAAARGDGDGDGDGDGGAAVTVAVEMAQI